MGDDCPQTRIAANQRLSINGFSTNNRCRLAETRNLQLVFRRGRLRLRLSDESRLGLSLVLMYKQYFIPNPHT